MTEPLQLDRETAVVCAASIQRHELVLAYVHKNEEKTKASVNCGWNRYSARISDSLHTDAPHIDTFDSQPTTNNNESEET